MTDDLLYYWIITGLLFYFVVFDIFFRSLGYRNSKVFLIPSCLILLFFMAFRSSSVGADTNTYCYVFDVFKNMRLEEVLYSSSPSSDIVSEPGYRLFNWCVGQIFNETQWLLIIESCLIIGLLYRLLQKWSAIPMLSIWLYFTLGIYQTQMNTARNAIAILLCYLAFGYIQKKKPIKYVASVGLVSLFHYSSFVFIPIYWLINMNKLSKWRIALLLFGAVVLSYSFASVLPFLDVIVPEEYLYYFAIVTPEYETLLLGALHAGLFLVVMFFVRSKTRNKLFQVEKIGTWMFILDVTFYFIAYTAPSVTRMAALFGPYLMIYLPNIIDRYAKHKEIVTCMIILLCGIQYLFRISMNNIGTTMPYVFFWEQ